MPQACRAVAGYTWMTADAREACCGVVVGAREPESDELACAR